MASSKRAHLTQVTSHSTISQVFHDPTVEIVAAFIFSERNGIVITQTDEVYKLETDIWDLIGKGSGRKKLKLLNDLSYKNIATFMAGEKHFFAISKNGNIFCCGQNNNGELGIGKESDILETFEENYLLSALKYSDNENIFKEFKQHCQESGDQTSIKEWFLIIKEILNKIYIELKVDQTENRTVKICCGSSHSLALTGDGKVYGWGKNEFGQTGNGTFKDQLFPNKIDGFDGKVMQIACGLNHSMALTESLKVYCWGRNDCGQLGFENLEKLNVAKQLIVVISKIELKFSQIACGESHSLLLSENRKVLSENKRVYAFGSNEFGQLGSRRSEKTHEPSKIECDLDFSEIASHFSSQFSVALRNGNEVYTWGKCLDEIIEIPKRNSEFEKISDTLDFYMKISYEPIKFNFNYNEYFFQNGRYDKEFDPVVKIGDKNFSNNPSFNCEVWEARNNWNKGNYVIKKIAFQHEEKNNVITEIEILAKSSGISAHVVQYYSSWFEIVTLKDWNGSRTSLMLYIQMEPCKTNLRELIKAMKNDQYFRKKQDKKEKFKNHNLTKVGYFVACELFREILKGVQYLHRLNIIHTDLKEDNIFITKGHDRRFVKIGDFGQSQFHEYSGQLHSARRGTQSYRAPEITSNIKEGNMSEYNTKADIYSLAVVIKNLFNIVPNTKLDSKNFHTNKYKELNLWYLKMKDKQYYSRPDCEEILNQRYSWGLRKQDFDSEIGEIEKTIYDRNKNEKIVKKSREEEKESEQVSLVYSILQSKLKITVSNSKIDNIPSLRFVVYPFNQFKHHIGRPDPKFYKVVLTNGTSSIEDNENCD